MPLAKILTPIFLVSMLLACAYEDSRAISGKILIRDILSDPHLDGRTINLSCITEAILAKPVPIIFTSSVSATDVSIEFKGYDEDARTIDTPGPGGCLIDLGYLKAGTYNLVFINGDHRDFGTMIVTKTDVSIDIPSPVGIEVRED